MNDINTTSVIQFPPSASSPISRRATDSELDAQINIPASVLENVIQDRDDIGLVFISYPTPALFPLNLTNRSIATSVIGARFSDETANVNLNGNITTTFQLPTPVCST